MLIPGSRDKEIPLTPPSADSENPLQFQINAVFIFIAKLWMELTLITAHKEGDE